MSTEAVNHPFVSEEVNLLMKKHQEVVKDIDYPKIGKIKLNKFDFAQLDVKHSQYEAVNQLPAELKNIVLDEENIVVLQDGNIIYKNLDKAFDQVKIMSYYDAVTSNDQEVLAQLTNDLNEESTNKFYALNKGYRNSSLYIEVPKNVTIRETLKVHLIASNDFVHRSVIIANQNSNLSLLEKIDNLNPVKANITTYTEVRDNAHVKYIGIDRLSEESLAFIDRQAIVKRDGNLVYALGQLNDGHAVTNNHVKLMGENSNCESRNVLMTDHESVHAVTVHIEHFAEHSTGDIVNHGIVKDNAYLHLDGIGKIHRGMRASSAHQDSHIIILSEGAKVDTNPYLLIDEYDVVAGHGAGIGQVDPEQLYYLMSRGMTKTEAERLIILGFLSPIIEMIDSEAIRNDFIETIERKLEEK